MKHVQRIGDFKILREVGHGGMGVVYEAIQIPLQRKVALKVLKMGWGTHTEAVSRFYREAQAAANLDHPNIVPIYAIGREDTAYYYAMEFIEGASLQELLPSRTFAFERIAQIILQAAQALQYAHQKGVVHRDIKPGNILLGQDGRVLLTDFGLAKLHDGADLTTSGLVMGTPSYMSPEQTQGLSRMDGRSDIYSLGATLYEMLTHHPPFTLSHSRFQSLPDPRAFKPDIPRSLAWITLKTLEYEPRRRYQHAQEMVDDLKRYIAGKPPAGIEFSMILRKKYQRYRNVIGTGIAFLLSFLFFWAFFTFLKARRLFPYSLWDP